MKDQVLGGVREYIRQVLATAHEIVDWAELEFRIRSASLFADDKGLDRKQAYRTELAVAADVCTDLSRAEVARLAGLSDEGVRTAVLQELGVTSARGEEYERARRDRRADLWVDDVVEHLVQAADVVRVAEACSAGSRLVRDELLVRAQELGVPGRLVQEWSGLSESGVGVARRRARAEPGDRSVDPPGPDATD